MNLARLEDKLLVLSDTIGVAAYDFDFDLHFRCGHPYRIDGQQPCVLRTGPITDYADIYDDRLAQGLRLVNSPEEHQRASELEHWYPRIEHLTPRSRVYDGLPEVDEIERHFCWPVFIKGSRQTSQHNPDLSVIRDAAHYTQVVPRYQADPILHWQKAAVREFVPLAPVAGAVPGKVRPSQEYRSFWWHGHCVGWGRYWHQVPAYEAADIAAGLDVARRAAEALAVPFLAVDLARTVDGRWIVVECNDAQESGYAGVSPRSLWQRILDRIDP